MSNDNSQPFHRQKFHAILGHITTIRAGIWDIQQSENLSQDTKDNLTVISAHAQQVVTEIEELRDTVYPLFEQKQ